MDHHCRKLPMRTNISEVNPINKCVFTSDSTETAWLNNCVGFGNHRYFFLYMLYTVTGSLFLIVFGIEIAYYYVWLGFDDEPLEGHPITYNSTGHIIPLVSIEGLHPLWWRKLTKPDGGQRAKEGDGLEIARTLDTIEEAAGEERRQKCMKF